MISYQVERKAMKQKIFKKPKEFQGYLMKPKLKTRKDLVEVSQIMIVHKDLKEKVLLGQFHVAFRKLLKMIMNLSEEGTESSGKIELAFNEITKMKQILKEKYKQNVRIEEYHSLVKKVKFLDKELKEAMIKQANLMELLYQKQMEQEYQEERGRGR